MDKNLGDDTHATGNGTVGATTVVATEFGDGHNHVTKLVLTATVVTVGDNAALAVGVLIYTFPTGIINIKSAGGTVAMTMADTIKTDTPEVGLGTVIASGANATIGAFGATGEDITDGIAVADTNGTTRLLDSNLGEVPFVVPAASAHTVHLNYADTWANVSTTAATVTGTVWLEWCLLA